uniref:olfactomedin-4 n=1 Tax=Doryrhamphus excisus TaxID=161450 RepID=UPI0025AE4EF1|nr:olfactomedin-4 [Doryrhamphus excisus]
MQTTLLLLLPVLGPTLAWIPVEDWESGNVTSSVGDSGQCVCQVYLPDTVFPADRMQRMQEVSRNLIQEVEIQKKNISASEIKLEADLGELQKLHDRVSILGSDVKDYIKLDFELLRIELREFESLVSQLKDAFNSPSPMFDTLYSEIRNMTLIVNQLESYDKNNLEMIRIEFAKLQRKLEECQDQEVVKPDIGNCNHTGIMSIGKPMVAHLNSHLQTGYTYGGWGKDSKPAKGFESMYFYSGYINFVTHQFYFFADYKDLLLMKTYRFLGMSTAYRGTGNNYIVRGNTVYYQRYSPFSMGRFNLTSNKYGSRVIPASVDFSYSFSERQNMDFAADETGLWVMYASDESKGNIVIAKVDEKDFDIENVWNTTAFKPKTSNAFMACGVMYATRPVDGNTEEIYYAFDTKSGEEKHLNIRFQKFQEHFSSLDYNPTDQLLYMYNNGYYVAYRVKFNME